MSLVSYTITSNGKQVPQDFQVLSIETTNEFNRIPYAEIAFLDGDPASNEFRIADSDFFEPGREIEIKLRYEDDASSEETVFSGVVVRMELKAGLSGSVFVVEAAHKAVKMTTVRKSARFEEAADSDVIKKITSDQGLQTGSVAATGFKHKQLVQYQATDWDFVLSRADANGLLMVCNKAGVSAVVPTTDGAPVLSFRFGIDQIFGFEVEADARHQHQVVESRSWDVKKQELINSQKAKEVQLSPGNLLPKKAGGDIAGHTQMLLSAVGLDVKEARAWADAKMARNRMSFVKGRLSVQGTALATTGSVVELEGISKRFSGPVLLSGVRHRVSEGGWTTDIQFGLPANQFSATADIVDAGAAGLLPGVNGLQIGKVVTIIEDPEKEARIKVKVPALNDESNGFLWSRIATPDAGNERGMCFWPEVDDEVVMGFLNDDPRQAVILGALHSSAKKPPIAPHEKNPVKGFTTRAGLQLIFDDEKKLVTILTSEKNSITVNEKDKLIEIKDVNNNVIKLDSSGITIESAKDVTIKSKGDMTLDAKGNVAINGKKIDIT